MYASSRARTIALAEKEAGMMVKKRMEATDPEDITEEAVLAELGVKAEGDGGGGSASDVAGRGGDAKGFSRPKRPGRR